MNYIIELLTESDGGHAVGEGNISDAIVEIKAMLEENARLKLQIGLLKNEVAMWKCKHFLADKEVAKLERWQGEIIERETRESEK